jgi:hypothetical protein
VEVEQSGPFTARPLHAFLLIRFLGFADALAQSVETSVAVPSTIAITASLTSHQPTGHHGTTMEYG